MGKYNLQDYSKKCELRVFSLALIHFYKRSEQSISEFSEKSTRLQFNLIIRLIGTNLAILG